MVLLEYWFVGDVVEVVPPKHKKSGKPWTRTVPSVTKETNTTTTDEHPEEMGPADTTMVPGNVNEEPLAETNSTIDQHPEEMRLTEISSTVLGDVTEEPMEEIPQLDQVIFQIFGDTLLEQVL